MCTPYAILALGVLRAFPLLVGVSGRAIGALVPPSQLSLPLRLGATFSAPVRLAAAAAFIGYRDFGFLFLLLFVGRVVWVVLIFREPWRHHPWDRLVR